MVRHRACLGLVGDILSKTGDDGADAAVAQGRRGPQGVLEFFAGHEPGDGAPHETLSRCLLTQPLVLRGGQQYAAHETHGAQVSVRGARPTVWMSDSGTDD